MYNLYNFRNYLQNIQSKIKPKMELKESQISKRNTIVESRRMVRVPKKKDKLKKRPNSLPSKGKKRFR